VSYRLGTERLADEIRRVAREQIEAALEGLAPMSDRAAGVHEARRRLKRLRSLLRLVRTPLGVTYGRENHRARDVGRAVAGVRDAQVARETFDRLLPGPRSGEVAAWRRLLEDDEIRATAGGEPLEGRLPGLRKELEAARRTVDRWPLGGVQGFEGLEAGLRRTYRRGRRGLRRAERRRTAETFHEWRKRVKHHREQVRLLQDTWTGPLRARRQSLSRLSDLLGEAHDLVVLRERLLRLAQGRGVAGAGPRVLAVFDRRRRRLEDEALPLGRRLFVEKPERLVRRLRVCWETRIEERALGARQESKERERGRKTA
jgi:CHAD domain-containing protein